MPLDFSQVRVLLQGPCYRKAASKGAPLQHEVFPRLKRQQTFNLTQAASSEGMQEWKKTNEAKAASPFLSALRASLCNPGQKVWGWSVWLRRAALSLWVLLFWNSSISDSRREKGEDLVLLSKAHWRICFFSPNIHVSVYLSIHHSQWEEFKKKYPHRGLEPLKERI